MSKPPESNNDPAAAARLLLREAVSAVLATGEASTEEAKRGAPSASLVTVASDMRGAPILLLSDIAHHTRNLQADARAALLIDGTAGFANPQEGPRVTFAGRIKQTSRGIDRDRFLARHADAAGYAGFADFNFYSMTVERVHFVGGFARAQWIPARRVLLPASDCRDMAAIEEGVIQHMNGDHAEALGLIGQRILGGRGKHWRMMGIDPDGFDIVCGKQRHRLSFQSPITTASGCRKILTDLAAKARAKK